MSNIWNFGENAGDVKHAVSGVTDDVIEQAVDGMVPRTLGFWDFFTGQLDQNADNDLHKGFTRQLTR